MFRKITQVDHYLTPSVNLYRELIESGWNVNTLGQDHENALVSAAIASAAASVAFLLQHGATVSYRALEFAIHSEPIDVFHLLATAKGIDYRSPQRRPLLL